MLRDVAHQSQDAAALRAGKRGVDDLPPYVRRFGLEAPLEPGGERESGSVGHSFSRRLADHEEAERPRWLVGQEAPLAQLRLRLVELRVPGEPHDPDTIGTNLGGEESGTLVSVQLPQHQLDRRQQKEPDGNPAEHQRKTCDDASDGASRLRDVP